jgi:hypothetical protein
MLGMALARDCRRKASNPDERRLRADERARRPRPSFVTPSPTSRIAARRASQRSCTDVAKASQGWMRPTKKLPLPPAPLALGKVIRAMGVKEFAAKVRMASPNVLRAIHPRHNPTRETLNRLLKPFRLRLSLAPLTGKLLKTAAPGRRQLRSQQTSGKDFQDIPPSGAALGEMNPQERNQQYSAAEAPICRVNTRRWRAGGVYPHRGWQTSARAASRRSPAAWQATRRSESRR